MTCDEFNFNVNLVFDNLGDAELSNEIQNHLKICYICSQEYNRLKNYFQKLHSNPKGIEVSEKYIQDTIDIILHNKVEPVKETKAVPIEVKLKTTKEKKPNIPEPEPSPVKEITINTVENKTVEPVVIDKIEIQPELIRKKVTKPDLPIPVQKVKSNYDLYFFYGVIGVSCLIIVYIILQFFIH